MKTISSNTSTNTERTPSKSPFPKRTRRTLYNDIDKTDITLEQLKTELRGDNTDNTDSPIVDIIMLQR